MPARFGGGSGNTQSAGCLNDHTAKETAEPAPEGGCTPLAATEPPGSPGPALEAEPSECASLAATEPLPSMPASPALGHSGHNSLGAKSPTSSASPGRPPRSDSCTRTQEPGPEMPTLARNDSENGAWQQRDVETEKRS